MGEITHGAQRDSNRKIRAKKQSTSIDMTPMVDLAFLLLTFFILTTTFKEAYVLKLTMPDKVEEPDLQPPINEKDVLNLVLSGNNRIFFWIGGSPPETTNFSQDGVRKILLENRNANPRLMVLIKPWDGARYQNIVDILDEMEITQTKRFAIVDPTRDDKTMISMLSPNSDKNY
jgi:biopolymer transport protein ExbD